MFSDIKLKEARTMRRFTIEEKPKELNFTDNCTTRWIGLKEQFREVFWEDLNTNILMDVKGAIQDQIHEDFEEQIGAKRYERTGNRQGERSGKRFRTLETEYGFIQHIEIPRARNIDIRFTIFDKWQRIQGKVLNAMLYAYLLARSSKAASKIVHNFGNSTYSRSFYQKLAKRLEQRMQTWQQRPIGKTYPYVFIDGMGVKVHDGWLKEKTVIWAIGMDENMKFELLGYVVANTESKEAVQSLLIDLQKRGLKRPQLFVSDESKGIESAISLEYPHVKHQICAFHKMKNIQHYLENYKNRAEILKDAADIYKTAWSKRSAMEKLKIFRKKWIKIEKESTKHFCARFEKTLRYFDFPKIHWKSIYTNNPMESFNSQMRTWTSKFKYFEGKANLDMAIFTYFYSKFGDLVSEMNSQLQIGGE
jgi:putative transposase